ncbi:MAG: DUF2279 domain-containing protein [Bacteroidetes bacterium]|nr:DUF2279 domain-containing protein [Bacteroidota bacterium]MBS1650020.1 DUF2279 domain-containing protein [Bacteroidota bacterium]
MKWRLYFICLLIIQTSFAQDSLLIKLNKKRAIVLGATNVVATVSSMAVLYNAWYKGYPFAPFHFFNDNNEWLQMDKVGHAWSAYNISRITSESFKWVGYNNKKSYWLGAASGLAYMSIIEVFDGFSKEWGFSLGDYTANIAGSAGYLFQQLHWKEQRIQIKFSSHINDYANYGLNNRADSVFGKNFFSRILKDYNAQTYWLSFNIASFFKQTKFPSWLNMAIGYGANGMFAASSNTVKDNNGNIIFNRNDIPRFRQFYLAPDIDFTKIKTHSKFLKGVFFALNAFKFPTPALELSQGCLQWKWMVF